MNTRQLSRVVVCLIGLNLAFLTTPQIAFAITKRIETARTLIFTATLYKNDRYENGIWCTTPTGKVEQNDEGDYTIEILDSAQKVLFQTKTYVSFVMEYDSSKRAESQSVDKTPLLLTLPLPKGAAKLRVLKSSKILAEIYIEEKIKADEPACEKLVSDSRK